MIYHIGRVAGSIALLAASVDSICAETPRLRTFKVGDVITVVQEASETNGNSTYNRQRNGQYTAQLAQFIRINSQGNLDNATNSSEIDGVLQRRLQSTSQVTESESMKYRIGASVVEVLRDGVLVLEAHKSWVDNEDLWEYTLAGKVDPKEVSPDGTILSKNVADLSISKILHSKLTDSTKRAWFIRLNDYIGRF
jgi:flagellar L-ring protein FlgH